MYLLIADMMFNRFNQVIGVGYPVFRYQFLQHVRHCNFDVTADYSDSVMELHVTWLCLHSCLKGVAGEATEIISIDISLNPYEILKHIKIKEI